MAGKSSASLLRKHRQKPKGPGSRAATRRAPSKRAQDRSDTTDIAIPQFNTDIAAQLAKCLYAGIPPEKAISYIVPGLRHEQVLDLGKKWLGDRRTLDAINTLNGGDWPELDADNRMSLALDHHRAECAYLLYTSRIDATDKLEFSKLQYAREVLEKFTSGEVDPTDPLQAFQRVAQDIMREAQKAKDAPQLTPYVHPQPSKDM